MSANARATTEDDFLGGRLVIEQPAQGFRAGLDAVLLAAAVAEVAGRQTRVLDVGAGVGTAGLCVAVRIASAHVCLVERSPELAALAERNITRNRLETRARIVCADITQSAARLEDAGIAANAFDVVIANPPYLDAKRHRLPADETAAGAFGMEAGQLEVWAKFMARAAAADGVFAMIHRADALGDVLAAIEKRFGGLCVQPLHPRQAEPAHRVIVTGRKGSRAPLQLLPGIVLHTDGNAFVPEVKSILRDGAALNAIRASS